MHKQYFLELLRKYLNDEATFEERQFLEKYYDLFLAEPDVVELLSDAQKEGLKTEINDTIWQNIHRDDKPEKKIIPLKPWLTGLVAAAVILAISITGFIFLQNQPVKKAGTAFAVRKHKKPNLFIILPDGSKVILSYGSKLTYASSFDGLPRRDVYLQGQAFFDIKHNNYKPFIVHTGKLETTVLGTAFNVKAMPGDATITVTVTRGRVRVSDQRKLLGIIKPNQQITYNRQGFNATQIKIDANIYTNWTALGDLLFEDVTVEAAAKLLEDRFKVKILFSDQLVRSKHFTSSFDKSASLEQALKSICAFNDAFYSYDKEKATVIINGKIN